MAKTEDISKEAEDLRLDLWATYKKYENVGLILNGFMIELKNLSKRLGEAKRQMDRMRSEEKACELRAAKAREQAEAEMAKFSTTHRNIIDTATREKIEAMDAKRSVEQRMKVLAQEQEKVSALRAQLEAQVQANEDYEAARSQPVQAEQKKPGFKGGIPSKKGK